MQIDVKTEPLDQITGELRDGMALAKCRKCGCMKDALVSIGDALKVMPAGSENHLSQQIERWQAEMEPIKYTCLGCDHCFPAVAMNAFNAAYPDAVQKDALGCGFEVRERTWPPVPGEYKVLCEGRDCSVAVTTLGSPGLVDRIAGARPEQVCIVGKTETENIGIDKIIKNTITNRSIRFLVLAGTDPKGHFPGQTLLSLGSKGVDERMRVIGSIAKRPILRNVTVAEVDSFRRQVQMINMIGCEDVDPIVGKVQEITMTQTASCGCPSCSDEVALSGITDVPVIQAKEPEKIQLDKAGYFVVLPQAEKQIIIVEHYSYDDMLLRTIQGKNARRLYWTIIENEWITELSHAAYIGKELTKAELSIKHGFTYVQDGA